jgi:hypothetical protein
MGLGHTLALFSLKLDAKNIEKKKKNFLKKCKEKERELFN